MVELAEGFSAKIGVLRKLTTLTWQWGIEGVDIWHDRLIAGVTNSITTSLNGWLSQHPFLNWLIEHPVISLGASLICVVLVIRLLITIYRTIASGIDRLWLAILRSPLWLIKLIFGWEVKPKTTNPVSTTVNNYEITSSSPQLEAIIQRLEQIQQQQQQILQDLALLKQQQALDVEAQTADLSKIRPLNFPLPPSK